MTGSIPFYSYRAFGLDIQSELEIAELSPTESANADLTIRVANVPENLDHVETTRNQWAANEQEFLLHVTDVASYHVSNGSQILVEPCLAIDRHAINAFILGSCMAAVLLQRHLLVLHASSFELNGNSYAICGKSGAGKSTTTAMMHDRGARLISDDVSAIKFDPAAMVIPGYPHSKLSAQSLKAVNVEPTDMRIASLAQKHKFVRPVKHLFCDHPTGLTAIFMLGFGRDGIPAPKVDLYQIGKSDAIRLLRNNLYRRQYILPRDNAMIFKALGKIVSEVPIFKLDRPALGDSFVEVNLLVAEQIEKMQVKR